MDLYQEQILEHWRHPKNNRLLSRPTNSAKSYNPLCGDQIRLDLEIKGCRVVAVGFWGSGCVISQATASLLTEEIKRLKQVKKIKQITEKDIFRLLGMEITTSRKKCALFSLLALKKALERYD